MKKSSLSVAMHAALQSWEKRKKSDDSTGAQIAQHAVAHGVSVSGLYRALIASGAIKKKSDQVAQT